MAFNKFQKEIISVLKSTHGIRWADLKKVIVDKKKICSERIFRETLNELVLSEVVFKYELSPQHIEYYLQEQGEDPKKLLDEAFTRHYSQLEFVINSIEKHIAKIPSMDLAGLIVTLWKMLHNLEFAMINVSIMHNKPKLVKGKDFKLLKIKLIEIMSKSKTGDDQIRLFDYIDRLLRWETYQFGELVKKELTDKQIPWFESKKPS